MLKKLLDHQVEGVEFLKDKLGAGLFFEMRLGKSLTILEHLNNLKLSGEDIFPALIVAPLSVVPVWGQEITKFGFDFSFTELTGTRKTRQDRLKEEKDVYVINYEGARIYFTDLLAKKFKTIILDESHRAKQIRAKQTQKILKLGEQTKRRYILSGTPVTKSPEDVWAQIQFICPGYLGNFFSFRSKYVEFRKMTVRSNNGHREIQVPFRFKNLKELEDRMSRICLRKTQTECLDLPEKSYKVIPCNMEGDQQKAYYQMKYNLQTTLEDHNFCIKNALTQAQKMQQICHGFLYDDDRKPVWFKNNVKLDILTDLLETISTEKIVLFCNFTADMTLLQSKFDELKYKYVVYYGDSQQREAAIKEFNESKEPVIFLTTIEVGKEGINLSTAAHVIYYGRNFNYASRYQSEARIQSVTQTRNMIYYDLVCPNTIDSKVLDVLQFKGETADKILGDSKRIAMLAADLL